MVSNLGTTTTIQVYYLGKYLTQIHKKKKNNQKTWRAVGGSAFEIKTFSEGFTCKKYSTVLNVITVFLQQAPNTNSKN